eukprot:CAMPEP_0115029300 /NCGR_PEP_ID=MMETSP0216-20121206/36898_1 /TAXON_ID=223996 /ORGANISM="Protocruzia adherens, Strain Boccale" /LENGTH=730 /DNA_ID=CAMNT_0002405817 /DNA_START=80 /DNA_END=2272 /DNA_ORIENTATION=-
MLIPSFGFNLNNSVVQGLATIARFDGRYPSMVCATSSGRLFMHLPHSEQKQDGEDVRFLNINRQISSISSGGINPALNRDSLFVGTFSSLMAYDTEGNSDLFFKDVTDGVNCLIFGYVQQVETPLVIAGGNCSIEGFDYEGEEKYWTVTGDNVSALAFCDIDMDGDNELLVGSDDFAIRIYRNDEICYDINESAKIFDLTPIRGARFGYAVENGTIGVYDKVQRIWRSKSKYLVTSLLGIDLDSDGIPEMISGWSSGKLEVRAEDSGRILYRNSMTSSIAKIMQADYRMNGSIQVLATSNDGEVKGFVKAEPDYAGDAAEGEKVTDLRNIQLPSSSAGFDHPSMKNVDEDALYKALVMKREETANRVNNLIEKQKKGQLGSDGLIPNTTSVSVEFSCDGEKNSAELILCLSNKMIIRSCILFAEKLFEGESLMIHPESPSPLLRIPLRPEKDLKIDVHMKILVGTAASSSVFHTFQLNKELPKFCMYQLLNPTAPNYVAPTTSFTFSVKERIQRLIMWAELVFICGNGQIQKFTSGNMLDLKFLCLRDGSNLQILMTQDKGGSITVRTDNVELAGDLIQDIASFMGLDTLEVAADMPHEIEELKQTLDDVERYSSVRTHLTGNIAEAATSVKTVIVRAEDARIQRDMGNMKRMYAALQNENGNLMTEYKKRCNNHQELMNCLKKVNNHIKKASNLRVGAAKTRVVNACRSALKNKQYHQLVQIIQTGQEK